MLMLLGALLLSACNLSRTPPTLVLPTPASPFPITPGVPTLFPSVTPFTFVPPGVTPQPATVCPPPVGWIPYVVEPGDTLSLLAQALDTTAFELAAANCLASPDALFAGQTIYLPRTPVSG